MNDKGLKQKGKLIPLLLSFSAGLAGLYINIHSFNFTYLGWELTLPLGYIFALYIALEWGALISLPAALISASFLFFKWDVFSWGTLYIYLVHVLWIPLMGWSRTKENIQDKYRFLTYIILFLYSFLNIALYHLVLKFLVSINNYPGNWESPRLLILSYRDNMTFLSTLNLARLIGILPFFNRLPRQNRVGRHTGRDGFTYILIIMGAIFVVWIFTLAGMALIEDGMTFAQLLEYGLSTRSLMNNLIYFNLVILTALVFYQNWEIQNQTARKLTERGDILTIILENISEGVLVIDDKWNLVFANAAVLKLGNYSESHIGQKMEEIFHLYTTEGESMSHEEVVQKLTSREPLNCLLKTSIGNYKRILIHISPLPKSRYGFKYLSLIRDITEEYEQEQRNIHTQKQEAVGRLVGGVAHDFNNRLAGIMGFAQLIDQEENPLKIKEYARYIVDSSQAAADLTNQLLTLSRKRPMEQKKVDITELLENLIPMLHHTLDRGVELVLNKDNQALIILGDPSLLENSIINLAVNASHAMKRKGILTFTTGTMIVDDIYTLKSRASLTPGRYACLRVQDTGAGIDPDLRDKIFDPFFTTKQEGEGTGLGLSTVREIIEKHGGEITLDSQIMKGSCFVIILPLIQEKPQHL